MIVFKRLYLTDTSGLESSIAYPDSIYNIKYKVGEVVLPVDGSYLYAFSCLEKAKNYAGRRANPTVYMCEADVVEDIPTVFSLSFSEWDMDNFWKYLNRDGERDKNIKEMHDNILKEYRPHAIYNTVSDGLKNAVFCRSIKLIKEIH